MTEELIIPKLYQLSENSKVEVLHFVEFLQSKYPVKNESGETGKRTFGISKGKYLLTADFDEPLEDFKDYM